MNDGNTRQKNVLFFFFEVKILLYNLRVPSLPHVHDSGLREEAGEPRQEPTQPQGEHANSTQK